MRTSPTAIPRWFAPAVVVSGVLADATLLANVMRRAAARGPCDRDAAEACASGGAGI